MNSANYKLIDIGSNGSYPGRDLSNFKARRFVMDGIECASMEGFLQSLKFDKPHVQVGVCKLAGVGAKNRGKERNNHWKNKQCLWWQGAEYDRHSDGYQRLIDRAYLEMARQCPDFRQALIDTGSAELTHKIGRGNPRETILTQSELCSRLISLRKLISAGNDLSKVSRL